MNKIETDRLDDETTARIDHLYDNLKVNDWHPDSAYELLNALARGGYFNPVP